ncbi:MAG: hypothetical protein U0Q03_01515 [Acidimicrobiales bacterium]
MSNDDVLPPADELSAPAATRSRWPLAVAAATGLVTLSGLVVAGVAHADRDRGWDRPGRHMWGIGSLLMMVMLVAAAVAITALLLGRRTPAAAGHVPPGPPFPPAPPAPPSPTATAEAILAERLARGEISPDDYRAASAALRGDPGPPLPA